MSAFRYISLLVFGFVISSVCANPVADFKLSASQGCVPLTVNFTNTSTGSGLTYSWEFGNGNRSILKNPSAIYYRSGSFSVKLTVTDVNGLTATKTFSTVRVFSNPVANFTADTVGCIGELLRFTDNSTKADTVITKWTWDYGDGNLSSSQNSVHPYSYSSTFTIGLTVTDANGCKSLTAKPKYIRIKPSPKASFKLNNTYSCSLPGEFKATNTSKDAISYKWVCSDGSTGTSKDFTTNIQSFGKYKLTLIAKGASGCTDSSVYSPLEIENLVAKFEMDNNAFCMGSLLSFKNKTTPNNSKIKYEWDFGDGKMDTSKNPQHLYENAGNYSVKLNVSFGKCSSSYNMTLLVKPSPEVEISVVDSSGCEAPFKAIFKIEGQDYTHSFWTFGDESPVNQYFAKGKTIEHRYDENGTFPVSARIINSFGCASEKKLPENISVGQQSVEINPKVASGCIPKEVKYTLMEDLYEDVVSYEWTFSDSVNKKYTTKDVNKVFSKVGKYQIHVKVTTIGGCVLEDDAEAMAGEHYTPTFYIKEYDICGTDTLTIFNTTHDSIKRKPGVTFSMFFPDTGGNSKGSYIKLGNIIVTKKGGKHILKMNTDHYGCVTQSEVSDSVFAHGPYLKLKITPITCKHDTVLVQTKYSWGNRYLLTKDSISLPYYLGEFKTDYQYNSFKFTGWNDTYKCKESITPEPYQFKVHDPGFNFNVNQQCSPVTGYFSHNGKMKKAKWLVSDGDTNLSLRFTKVFTKAGQYKVKLIGYYDSALCMDTNTFSFAVTSSTPRSTVVSKGLCLPLKLTLIDTSFGTDNYNHTWTVLGNEMSASAMKMDVDITNVRSGDSFIHVLHTIETPQGCKSTKEFKIPFSGPKVRYTVDRFTICDTPVFYFKTFIDSSGTKFPVKYDWQMSSGLKSDKANLNAKFKTMGMNYFTLKLTDPNGCQTVFNDSFEASPNMLLPQFKADPTGRFCPPLECSFTDMSKTFVSEIVKWEWDFGDGTTSDLKNPKKLYLLPGKYDLKLTVTSKWGCTASLVKPGYIIVNGPIGKYDFDRGDACLPHTVQFRGSTIDSATMEWDLGDGVVQQGNYFKHTYKTPGRFIPAFILSDTLGCKYTLPPIDTIEVFDYPRTKLVMDGLCLKQPIRIRRSAQSNNESTEMNYEWFYNGKKVNLKSDSLVMPKARGIQKFRMIAENAGKCKDTADAEIRIFAPVADFKMNDKFVCLGMPVTFINHSSSDTGLSNFSWDFGDANTGTGKDLQHTYNRPGEYNVRLIAVDKLNCADTMIKPKYAVVGDTIAPPLVPIRRASVLNDHATELVYAKFPNFDFNSYQIYKENNGKFYKIGEVKQAEDTLFRDNLVNTLNQSYCYKIRTKNLCLLESDLTESKEHCTIETKAKGLFEANLVNWSPYVGFDSIARYQIWRADYTDRNNYLLIDSVNGTTLNYTDTNIACFTRRNYKIKAIQFGGFGEFSNSDTASAKPSTINTTRPNYTWRTTVEANDYTRLEWLNNAWSRNGIKGYLVNKSFADGGTIFNNKYFDASDTVLEDVAVNVNKYSYVYTMRGIDNCNDTTPWSNPAQSILLKGWFDESKNKPAISWNHYRQWDQGIAYYEVERKLSDGSFMVIGKVSADVNSFVDMSAEDNCSPNYIYRVRAVSLIHQSYNQATFSLSNETLVLPYSKLFVPNAFSPDANKINESFGPNGQYISKYSIKIYNRWGELLFESNDCMAQWNGQYMGETCQQDAYMYVIEAKGADNKLYNLSGTFHLLR